MKEESNNTKKLSLDKKQIILLVFLVFLILILSVFLYVRKNRNSDTKQNQGEEKIVSELEDEEDLGESLEEENVEEDVEESTPESSKSTTPSKPTEPKKPEKPVEEKVPETPDPPKPLTPREQVESLWTSDATSVIIDSTDTITINGTKYLTVTVRRGTLKVGDTLKQTGVCGIVPNVSTKVQRMIKKGKLVNSATVSESVGISMDNDYFYKRATFGTDMQLATRAKLKVYVFTKEEGNTKETSVVNGQGYLLTFMPKDADPSGKPFKTGNGTPVISKPIKPGEVAEIEIRKFIMLGGPALYEPGTRIIVKDQNTNERIGIAVITGYPPCPHK